MANVAVIGAGAWGSALAIYAARQDHRVRIWAHEPDVVEEINRKKRNSAYMPWSRFMDTMEATTDPAHAVEDADVVLLVPPSRFLRYVSSLIAPHLPSDVTVVVASKGIEVATLSLMSDVIVETLPNVPEERLVFLSGPSFAKEVAEGWPTDVVVACKDIRTSERLQELMHSPVLRFYSSQDPIGVEIGGAIKNVLAVATGVCDGLGFGLNARAALITRGLAEMTRLGVALGADPLTFIGLSGVGDLILTCTGGLSRNRQLGLKVAEGFNASEYLATQKTVAEGFYTAKAAWNLAQKTGVDMPITEQVYNVLHEGRPVMEAIRALVTRPHKNELQGIRQAFYPPHDGQ